MTMIMISRKAHSDNFTALTNSLHMYAKNITLRNVEGVSVARAALLEKASAFLAPYGVSVNPLVESMLFMQVQYKKEAHGEKVLDANGNPILSDNGRAKTRLVYADEKTFIVSGASCRKFIKEVLLPTLGVEFGACIEPSEKKTRAKKENRVDFGSMSVMDIVNGMSAEKVAEFRAAFAALDARSEIAAD